jgi:hypothetical protein
MPMPYGSSPEGAQQGTVVDGRGRPLAPQRPISIGAAIGLGAGFAFVFFMAATWAEELINDSITADLR